MGKVRFTTEQIIRKLGEAEVLHSQGATITENISLYFHVLDL